MRAASLSSRSFFVSSSKKPVIRPSFWKVPPVSSRLLPRSCGLRIEPGPINQPSRNTDQGVFHEIIKFLFTFSQSLFHLHPLFHLGFSLAPCSRRRCCSSSTGGPPGTDIMTSRACSRSLLAFSLSSPTEHIPVRTLRFSRALMIRRTSSPILKHP